jgi:hypothetical protein
LGPYEICRRNLKTVCGAKLVKFPFVIEHLKGRGVGHRTYVHLQQVAHPVDEFDAVAIEGYDHRIGHRQRDLVDLVDKISIVTRIEIDGQMLFAATRKLQGCRFVVSHDV